MTQSLDAIEDLLATFIAGRMRLRVLSHRHLSFSNALLADGVHLQEMEQVRSEVSLVQDLVRQHVRTVMPPQRLEPRSSTLDDPPTQIVRNVKNRTE